MFLGPLDLTQSQTAYMVEKLLVPLKKKSERKRKKTFERNPFFQRFFFFKGFLALFAVISWGEADLLFKACKVGVVVISHLEGNW